MENIKIGEKIKELRTKEKLSQRELASMCGISYSNLNIIENGKVEPSMETLIKLSKVLGSGLIGSHMAYMKNNNEDVSKMLSQYVDDLSKKDFNVFYGLIEHICENYCNDIDPQITLINSHVNYDDLRDLLIDVVKSRLNYYIKREKENK